MTGETYSDTMTAVTWFIAWLMLTTLVGLAFAVVSRHIHAAYMATLMEIKERKRRR